jgi:hypothetical protein
MKRQKPNAQPPLSAVIQSPDCVFTIDASNNARAIVDNTCAGARIVGLTRGAFSLLDLIHQYLLRFGAGDVIICTWSAGVKDARAVKWLQRTKLIRRLCIITDHSYSTRQKTYAVELESLFGRENIRTSEIHAKFVLIDTGSIKICIRSSMNLNANRTCESFEIDASDDVYAFYHGFAMSVIKHMPEGFTASSAVANDALDNVFRERHKPLPYDDDSNFERLMRSDD